jgi:hypothetical protein
MAKTNLNVSPYFDDFDAEKNYYKVLFKPGYPVQARELTTLQSILQEQVSSLGKSIFKDGSVVVPGEVSYDPNYYAVKINPIHLGLDVELYYKQLIGKKIIGDVSQVTAVVQNVLSRVDSTENVTTLYVKYTNSNSSFQNTSFVDGETLTIVDSIQYGNTVITGGNTIGSLIDANSVKIGSAVSISPGIYFIRGLFVKVSQDTIILDQYANTPSYRVGLSITENFVTSFDDNSLYDNAKGFTNYSAPGADRFNLTTKLSKQGLQDFNDTNFIEILRITNGVVKKVKDTSDYSLIKDYLAKRTFEQTGHFTVSPFSVDVVDSLNNLTDLNGLYKRSERTDQNNVPREDLLCVKVSSGKAYVSGNEIEKSATNVLDIRKARSTNTVSLSPVQFEMGSLIVTNNVSGCPAIGLNNSYTIDLFDSRKSSNNAGTGTTIGKARVYSFSASDSSYVDNSSRWNLYLYDIQTYTKLTLNTELPSEVSEGSRVRGLRSGASGFISEDPNNTSVLYVYQTSGTFLVSEELEFNENKNIKRSITDIKIYSGKDIKSVYQDSSSLSLSGLSTDFSADVFLNKNIAPNFSVSDSIIITPESSGISTITSPGKLFDGIKLGSIVRYQKVGFATEFFNKVESISSDKLEMTVSAVPNVDNVCLGSLHSGSENLKTLFTIGESTIQNKENSNLYASLQNKNVSSVNLSSSTLTIIKQATGKTTSSTGTLALTVDNFNLADATFEPYSVGRYSLFYNDGTVETLTAGKLEITNSGQDLTLYGLKSDENDVTVVVTLKKTVVRNKSKIYKKSEKIVIDRTSLGISDGISGLSTSKYYGVRVEDQDISLNVPDVSEVIAIYESTNSSEAILDKLTFSASSISGAIVGERIVGSISEAVGQIVSINTTDITFVYLNSNRFTPSDVVSFSESNISSPISSLTPGAYIDRTDDFVLDKGQKSQYYDYSRIVRSSGTVVPAKKLTVIYNAYGVSEADSGDFYTASSYNASNFKNYVPSLNNDLRASDVLDFRPRVSSFNSTITSPFNFDTRNFATSLANPQIVVAPNESSVVSYQYYVPRIDRLVLNKGGNFQLIVGSGSPNPQPPTEISDAMNIATLEIPAYVYDVNDIKISLVENRRYTMKDIGSLEDRIENLEKFASLTLLELDVKSLQVIDDDGLGLSKFKCGFFADSFVDTSSIDFKNQDTRASIDGSNGELTTDLSIHTLKSQILPSNSINLESADYSTDIDLLDPNIKKTGDLITLNYSEKLWGDISQEFATTKENLNPHGLSNFNGKVALFPSTDLWVKTINNKKGNIVRTQSLWDNSYISNLYLSSENSNKMRSRNVQFSASDLVPLSRYTSSLDGSSSVDIIPKLLKINMISGIFTVGETVEGYVGDKKVFSSRVCEPNHKNGLFSAPSETYAVNPYQSTEILTDYAQSTSVLNIDTYSLADNADGRFYGYVFEGMRIIGKTSGAQCDVTSQDLITDNVGDLIGCFYVRNPFTTLTPSTLFNVSDKTFRLQTDSTPTQTSSISLRSYFCESSLYLSDNPKSSNISLLRRPVSTRSVLETGKSYLSQTFKVDNEGGFLTSVDLFFANKDDTEKVTVEIREVDLGGRPTAKILQDFSVAQILPANITTSTDGSVATNIKFKSPVYLEPNKQYALTLFSASSSLYSVWTATSNEATVATQNFPNSQQIIYSNQFIGGNLYKPQNGAIATASLLQDLKFKLYKAQFVDSGTAFFTNPLLSNNNSNEEYDANIENLVSNPITSFPKKQVIGITTSYLDPEFYHYGRKVIFGPVSNNIYGFIEQSGGKISGISTNNVGAGYSNGTYSNAELYTINGFGPEVNNVTANLTFANNQLSSVTITNGGSGYSVGDLLGIKTTTNPLGSGAIIGVSSISGVDTLLMTNINKNNSILLGHGLSVLDDADNVVSLAGTSVFKDPRNLSDLYSGNVFKVDNYSHGMHSTNNYVKISGVFPDTIPSQLNANITADSNVVSIADTSQFVVYDNIAVAGVQTGYMLINNEIISYNQVNSGSLQINQRGVHGSTIRNHSVNDMVYKYECGGVGLTRINTRHQKSSSQYLNSLETTDSFFIEYPRADRIISNFVEGKTFGGLNCKSTQNYQFNSIIPSFNFLTPPKTSVNSSIRTITGTSSNGTETSFIDKGLEPIALNTKNDFDSTRLVASRMNELEYLQQMPRYKSLILSISMSSKNNNVSPVIDLANGASFSLIRNRLNSPISDYASDSRSNALSNDPHASVYISNQINLLKPATSLKVLTNCYNSPNSDFRVLLKLIRPDSNGIEQSYELFPGYSNLKDVNGDGVGDIVIDTLLNDGSSDFFVGSSAEGEYSEYEFTANNLGEFVGFSIKIVMSGSNEATPLKFKDIRAVALA